jgi:archaellum component FlaG (FlaF/FlaG flagellin family)
VYKVVIFICSLLIAACSTQAKVDNVSFYDTQGVEYESLNAGKIIKKNYNLISSPATIILATADTNLPAFISQLNSVNLLDAEEYEYLLVIADTKNIDNSGYHTSARQAEEILKGNTFKIIIFNGQGNVVVESSTPIGADALRTHLTKPII